MITVVIVSYKYGHLVCQAIESVLSQTLKADKILVVDDFGRDGVESNAMRYGVQCIVRTNNMGIVDNFQDILMKRVTTSRVLMLGADNWLRQDALAQMAAEDADIVSTDIALTGELNAPFAAARRVTTKIDGYPIWQFKKGNINTGNYIHGSSLYNTKLAQEVGGYTRNTGTNSEEDWMLWQKMLAAGATHTHIPDYLLYYRRHKENFQ